MKPRRFRRRQAQAIAAPRGRFCEDRFYSGPHAGSRCVHPAIGYQGWNDIFLCGLHARAYLDVDREVMSR